MLPRFKPCPSDASLLNVHESEIFERILLEMNDEDFLNAQPKHLKQLKENTPFQTGVSWIDEQEARLYARDRD